MHILTMHRRLGKMAERKKPYEEVKAFFDIFLADCTDKMAEFSEK